MPAAAALVPTGAPYELPIYLRLRNRAFGDDDVRHILLNIVLPLDRDNEHDVLTECLMLRHECAHHFPTSLSASYPPRPGTQVFIPQDVFSAPIYVIISRRGLSGRQFLQAVSVCLAVVFGRDNKPRLHMSTESRRLNSRAWRTPFVTPYDSAPAAQEAVELTNLTEETEPEVVVQVG